MRPGGPKCAFKSVEWQQRGDAAGLCRVGQLVKNSENPKIIREGMGLACPHAAALVVFKASNYWAQRAIPLPFRHSYFRQSGSRTG